MCTVFLPSHNPPYPHLLLRVPAAENEVLKPPCQYENSSSYLRTYRCKGNSGGPHRSTLALAPSSDFRSHCPESSYIPRHRAFLHSLMSCFTVCTAPPLLQTPAESTCKPFATWCSVLFISCVAFIPTDLISFRLIKQTHLSSFKTSMYHNVCRKAPTPTLIWYGAVTVTSSCSEVIAG